MQHHASEAELFTSNMAVTFISKLSGSRAGLKLRLLAESAETQPLSEANTKIRIQQKNATASKSFRQTAVDAINQKNDKLTFRTC